MNTLRIGDSRKLIKELPDKSVDCVMTSPPYWGLRDYGHTDQIGLEKTPEEYLKTLFDFFDDVKLKLKEEGNCFVNLGDSYMSGGGASRHKGYSDPKYPNGRTGEFIEPTAFKHPIIVPKSLCMIPQRFAWGMIERGWILRNEIIWAKPNHMPESVTDRLTKAHEVIYHFVKQGKYYYNLDAIREPFTTNDSRNITDRQLKYRGKFDTKINVEAFGSPRARSQRKHQIGDGYRQGMNRDESEFSIQRVHEVNQKEIAIFLKEHIKDIGAMDAVFGEHKWRHWIRTDESGGSLPNPDDWKYLREFVAPWLPNTFDEVMTKVIEVPQIVAANSKGKNPGDVWNITTQPYPESHFAVFPLELVRKPILAGCPIGGTVLDPFGGSGTVGEFCRHNDRNAILFELNPAYKPLIEDRAMLNISELSEWG